MNKHLETMSAAYIIWASIALFSFMAGLTCQETHQRPFGEFLSSSKKHS